MHWLQGQQQPAIIFVFPGGQCEPLVEGACNSVACMYLANMKFIKNLILRTVTSCMLEEYILDHMKIKYFIFKKKKKKENNNSEI